MLINLKRIVKAGWLNFWRNKLLSFATLAVMTLVLLVVAGLLLLNVASQSLIASLENKVDVSVYFKTDTPEQDILSIKDIIKDIGSVAAVSYVSREQALDKFKQDHFGQETFMQSLEVLGDNPLSASINIKARQAKEYVNIVSFIERANFRHLIDRIDFRENEAAINKLINLSRGIRRLGLIVSLFLALVVLLVSFNTIRLAIYNQKNEIMIMRLVGASNWSIRGPFLIEGLLYGMVGSLVTVLVLWPSLVFASSQWDIIFSEINLLAWFENNVLAVWLLLFGVGTVLGLLSSLIAIRRYLKV